MIRVAGRSGFLALGLIVAAAATANSQEPPRGFAWGASGILMFWTEEQDPFDRLGGPGAQVSYLAPNAIGFEFRATYLVESGFYGLNGVNGELAVTWSIPTGRHLVQLKAGGHGMLAGDSDGSFWAGGGPYGGGGAIISLGGRIGLQLDLLGRLFVVSGRATFAPGGAVALVLLPR